MRIQLCHVFLALEVHFLSLPEGCGDRNFLSLFVSIAITVGKSIYGTREAFGCEPGPPLPGPDHAPKEINCPLTCLSLALYLTGDVAQNLILCEVMSFHKSLLYWLS